MDTNRVHEVGAERHGAQWLSCNRRAVEIMWSTKLRADSPEAKEVVPLILLMVLDRAKLAQGLHWDKELKQWIYSRPTPETGDAA